MLCITKYGTYTDVILQNEYTDYIIYTDGRIYDSKNKRFVMYDYSNTSGYVRVSLRINNTKRKKFFVHRLVAIAFISNPLNKPHVNHIDGNKKNNDVSNLEWVTPEENNIHAYKIGLHTHIYGDKVGSSKYNNAQIVQVCKLLEQNQYTIQEISKITGVDNSTIRRVLSRKQWKNISINYDIDRYDAFSYNKLSESDISTIYELMCEGKSNIDILKILFPLDYGKHRSIIKYYRKKYTKCSK